MGRVAGGEELGVRLEQWEALGGGGCGCTCGRRWQGAGRGEVAWRGVVEMWPHRQKLGGAAHMEWWDLLPLSVSGVS